MSREKMKRIFKLMMSRLLACLLINAAGITGMAAPSPALEVSGISSFFGSKSACLIFQQPNALAPHGFLLAEGQSRFGIRLISVNAVSNIVQVENGGQIQFLRLLTARNQASSSISETAEYQEFMAHLENIPSHALQADDSVDMSKMNNTALNNIEINGNGMSGAQKIDNLGMNQNSPAGGNGVNASQNSPASLNGSNPAAALKDQSSATWYQDSARMEKNRMATASSVLAGEMEPWPLTPLTPAGTPANLIGDDAIYANHIPGFYGN
jgi:hypothetical protein